MQDQTAGKDPLAPIDFVVSVLTTLLVVGLVFTAVSSIFDSGGGFGFGSDVVCADYEAGAMPWGGRGGGHGVVDLVDDARAYPAGVEVCTAAPTIRDRFYLGLTVWPSLLFTLGFLVGLRLVIRAARREGMFTTGVARRVTMLGWYLLAVPVVVATLEATGNALLLRGLVEGGIGWLDWQDGLRMSWSALIGGFGLITFGRLLQRTVPMREELDATV